MKHEIQLSLFDISDFSPASVLGHVGDTLELVEPLKRNTQHPTPVFVEPSLEQVERLLSRLRSGALVLAMLAYGLRLPISVLRGVRIRDVDTVAGTVVVSQRVYAVPAAVVDDLREFHQERLSELKRCDAGCAFERRGQPLFQSQVVEVLYNEVTAWWDDVQAGRHGRGGAAGRRSRVLVQDLATPRASGLERAVDGPLRGRRRLDVAGNGASVDGIAEGETRRTACRILDRGLSLLGRQHLRSIRWGSGGSNGLIRLRAVHGDPKRSGVSPLDLFDKGPRIVRRTYAGVVQAYYLWRARAVPQVRSV